MVNIKNHIICVGVLLVIIGLALGLNLKSWTPKHYSFADLGVNPPTTTECSQVKDKNNYPVNLSFNAPDVSALRTKIKTLINKYSGQISSDSYNNYPGPAPQTPQENTNLNVSFAQGQKEFLAELTELVKNNNATESGYFFQSGPPQGGFSSYSSCLNMLQVVTLDKTQMELFTRSLQRERQAQTISLLSQLISNAKTTLQTDINNLNDFFTTADKPMVSIAINSVPK